MVLPEQIFSASLLLLEKVPKADEVGARGSAVPCEALGFRRTSNSIVPALAKILRVKTASPYKPIILLQKLKYQGFVNYLLSLLQFNYLYGYNAYTTYESKSFQAAA